MGTLLGNDYLVWIESATPGTYNVLKGQQTVTQNRSQQKFDTSSKDTQGYATSGYGLKDLTHDLDLLPTLPDATGYTRLETLCNAQPRLPFNIQIRKGGLTGASPGDVVFQGSVYGSIASVGFDQNNVVKAKAQFALAAAPTIDTLA